MEAGPCFSLAQTTVINVSRHDHNHTNDFHNHEDKWSLIITNVDVWKVREREFESFFAINWKSFKVILAPNGNLWQLCQQNKTNNIKGLPNITYTGNIFEGKQHKSNWEYIYSIASPNSWLLHFFLQFQLNILNRVISSNCLCNYISIDNKPFKFMDIDEYFP